MKRVRSIPFGVPAVAARLKDAEIQSQENETRVFIDLNVVVGLGRTLPKQFRPGYFISKENSRLLFLQGCRSFGGAPSRFTIRTLEQGAARPRLQGRAG